jgi:hypothetical protein
MLQVNLVSEEIRNDGLRAFDVAFFDTNLVAAKSDGTSLFMNLQVECYEVGHDDVEA